MQDVIGEDLPPLYAGWMRALLITPIERETKATCGSCVMCRSTPESVGDANASERRVYFRSDTKCCTYIPWLPNFLLGRILHDDDMDARRGRESVEARLAKRLGVSPMGLAQPAAFSVLYRHSSESFGRSLTLRCPHYIEDGGRCGVWRHRNSICSTWFCKHERGASGKEFWRALQSLLDAVELALARWAAADLLDDAVTLAHVQSTRAWNNRYEDLTGDALDGRIDAAQVANEWGPWLGREHEFFRRCAERVDALTWEQVLKRCEPSVLSLAQTVLELHSNLSLGKVPEVLVPGDYTIVGRHNQRTVIDTYRAYDPIEIPDVLIHLLDYFDGRPTDQVVAAIAADHAVELQPDLLRKLADFRVLVAPS